MLLRILLALVAAALVGGCLGETRTKYIEERGLIQTDGNYIAPNNDHWVRITTSEENITYNLGSHSGGHIFADRASMPGSGSIAQWDDQSRLWIYFPIDRNEQVKVYSPNEDGRWSGVLVGRRTGFQAIRDAIGQSKHDPQKAARLTTEIPAALLQAIPADQAAGIGLKQE
ncbi:MAG: hypothetical protein AAF492_18680 [Verrucomicrobiota bacterium]